MRDGIFLPAEVIFSDEFAALGKPALNILPMILMRRKFENGSCINESDIEIPWPEIAKTLKGHISRRTFYYAIDQLIELGFIRVVSEGNGIVRAKYELMQAWMLF